MHLNSKKSPISVTTAMLSIMPHVKVKKHGFVTFASRSNPRLRYWGHIVGSLPEKVLKKAEVPSEKALPDGVVVVTRKSGAVTRFFLMGEQNKLAQVAA